jgi:hypothetical protein
MHLLMERAKASHQILTTADSIKCCINKTAIVKFALQTIGIGTKCMLTKFCCAGNKLLGLPPNPRFTRFWAAYGKSQGYLTW